MSFENKVVIVTGSSSGIGATTAVRFAEEGANVTIVGRNETKLNEVAQQIGKFGKKPLIIKADVSKDDEARKIITKTIERFGKLDVLVNNAGFLKSATIFDDNLLEVYDEVMSTNLRSAILLTNLAAPHLVKTKGNIINVSSVAGTSAMLSLGTGYIPYCTSKAGMDHFSRVAAAELAAEGVRVNAISPGPVKTLILENAGRDSDWDAFLDKVALKRLTEPEEVADLIMYLASDKARSITGSNYSINCGIQLFG